MGVSVADALMEDVKPADRSAICRAETGFNKGIMLAPNFSDVCNDPRNGKPAVRADFSDDATKSKIEWANSVLMNIFGDNVKPLPSSFD
jgi:hypothetical protein